MGIQNNHKKALFEIARTQQGYFTAGQAQKAGYRDSSHPYHVREGNWEREGRGIYRLAEYPLTDESQLVKYYLWSRNRDGEPQGVYSHETALHLNDLSDVMPSKLHITMLGVFRRTATIPKVVSIHIGNIKPEDIEEREGYRLTKPFKTIKDLLMGAKTESKILEGAVRDAYRKGMISKSQVEYYKDRYYHYGSQAKFLRGMDV